MNRHYDTLSDQNLMAEVNSRPSHRPADLKWAAILYGALHQQGHLTGRQREVLSDILEHDDRVRARQRVAGRVLGGYDNEKHDHYGKP